MSSQGLFIFTYLFTKFHLLPLPISAQPIHADPAALATIPGVREQACHLDLPDSLFHDIKSACVPESRHKRTPDFYSGQAYRNQCCPVLAAWLYSAYSATALQLYATTMSNAKAPSRTMPSNMPDVPNDYSNGCVFSLIKALDNRGVALPTISATCDVVSCVCGIGLRRLSCPESFRVNSYGKLVRGDGVKELETNCSNKGHGASLHACTRCLNALVSLNGRSNGSNERSSAVQSRHCELMGLTWLLNKNRSVYMSTVTTVLRSTMMNTDDHGSFQGSCTINKPFAADTTNQSSFAILRPGLYQHLLPLSLFLVYSILVD